ncbi:mitochondrial carrier protein MTM1-like isoform X2 [Durio zibethinus]|uniref:Mitochondrial carrier protein MTM1-like isoform X2 n=1 Tax=Durio zibethinus TaxID=66656 RepID=A0A6P5X624_DURZI|nr:mitochondrial carrier protein MTM1-like isoform X2 [Durio zibethinus]
MEETDRRTQTPWMSLEQSTRIEIKSHDLPITEPMVTDRYGSEFVAQHNNNTSDSNLGIVERAFSAAGAAFLSAIIVNPLDVVKEGFSRLWRGTNAGLALAVPTVGIYLPCYDMFRNWMEGFTAQQMPGATPYVPLVAGSLARSLACVTCYPIELARTRMQAFKEAQIGKKPPGVLSTLLGVLSNVKGTNSQSSLLGYRILWTGMGAQLARDVPFSGICWSTLEPIRRRLLGFMGEESNVATVLGANFSAGFVAGSLAAAATCPLDVAKTRRQIEKDPARALRMTTRQTLMEVWRDGGMRGLFTGVGPRVGRAGPSVGIVVSFYEVVKYVLHHNYATS